MTDQNIKFDIVQIISEWRKNPRKSPIKNGYKRVQAIVRFGKVLQTRHIDILR